MYVSDFSGESERMCQLEDKPPYGHSHSRPHRHPHRFLVRKIIIPKIISKKIIYGIGGNGGRKFGKCAPMCSSSYLLVVILLGLATPTFSNSSSSSNIISTNNDPNSNTGAGNSIIDISDAQLNQLNPALSSFKNNSGNKPVRSDLEQNDDEDGRNTQVYEHWANYMLSNYNNYTLPVSSSILQKAKSRGLRSVCKISEFVCSRGKCVSSDKFCDGKDDCGDLSDEPTHCTPCNRTYYGEWGRTYSLSLTSATMAAAIGLTHEQQLQEGGQGGHGSSMGSSQSKKPVYSPHFVCQLTFAAAGDNFGDLVQIMLDSMNIGQFASSTQDGCPEGSLQVAEISRPITGGKWCGSGQGYAVYFSEMSAIALTLTVGGAINGRPLGRLNTTSSTSLTSKQQQQQQKSSNSLGSDGLTGTSGARKPLDSSSSALPIPQSSPVDFDFKIRYKFIPRSLASVRYGPHGSPVERGEVVPGSYCSRDFEACHRRRCKIQSPNYPGLYPRNVTCQFRVRHRDKQPCKHVLIQVAQLKSHKVQLKAPSTGSRQPPSQSSSSSLSQGSSGGVISGSPQSLLIQEDAIMAWEECQGNRDSLTVYDGNSMDASILLKMCGGGHVPPITSSGPEILVVFRATPYGNPLDPKPSPPYPEPLRGFELDVDVIMVDSESADYYNSNNCTFYFVSTPADKCLLFKPQEHGGNWISGKTGKVTSPRHTIPPNTTCRYEFKGNKDETVWVYFVSYRRSVVKDSKPIQEGANCSNRLTIRDGIDSRNEALLGSFCDSDLPKLCDHKALQNESRSLRACTESESYISAGSRLIIEQKLEEGTALRPVHYQFYYEFVSRHPGTDGSCNRHYNLAKMKAKGSIRTSDNVFDFGRGGRQNLTCTYTFTLGTYEALRLTVKNSSFGDRPCRTAHDFETSRYICNYMPQYPYYYNNPLLNDSSPFETGMPTTTSFFGSSSFVNLTNPLQVRSELNIYEQIWSGNKNITSHRQCICSNSSGSSGFSFLFLGRTVELTFRVEDMKARDSYENFFVHLEYEVIKGEGCRGDNHYMKTESGLISLESSFSQGPRNPTCHHYPWLLEAKENHSLYLRIPGFPMLEEKRVHHQHYQYNAKTFPNTNNNLDSANNNHTSSESQYISSNMTSEAGSSSKNLTAPYGTPTTNTAMLPGLAKFQIDRICPTTKNRIFIYDGNNKLIQKICPASISQFNKKSSAQIVEIYSEDFGQFHSPLFPPPKSRFVIEFVGKEMGTYQIKWLELISAKMKTTLKAMEYDHSGKVTGIKGNNLTIFPDMEDEQIRRGTPSWDETLTKMFEGHNGERVSTDSLHVTPGDSPLGSPICPSYCPELRACISEKLWCDGEIHCPVTKLDESQCDTFWATLNQFLSPAVYIPLLAAVASALCCCVLVILCVAVKRMITKMRSKGQLGIGSSVSSSRTSTVDRRVPSRDYFYDPHEPIS